MVIAAKADTSELDELFRRLEQTADGAWKGETFGELASKGTELVERQFVSGTAPDGKKWKPKKRGNGKPVGHGKTEKLSSGVQAVPTAEGIDIVSPTGHATFFDGGTKHMVARPIAPKDELPSKWEDAFEPIIEKAVKKSLGV